MSAMRRGWSEAVKHRWSHSRGLIRCTRCGISARDEHGRRIIHIEDVPESQCLWDARVVTDPID